MNTFAVKHPFPFTEDHYWANVFLDEGYNTALYTEGLGFQYEQQSLVTGADGVITRRIRVVPVLDLPKPARKALGDSLSYIEEGRLDPRTRRWSFALTPSKMADRITVRGEFWSSPLGADQMERHCRTEIGVKWFGIGGVVEKAVEKAFRESYQKAADFTAQWAAR